MGWLTLDIRQLILLIEPPGGRYGFRFTPRERPCHAQYGGFSLSPDSSDSDCTPGRLISPRLTDLESDSKPNFGIEALGQGQEVRIFIDDKVDTLIRQISHFKEEWITGPDKPASYNDDLRLSCFTHVPQFGQGETETNPI